MTSKPGGTVTFLFTDIERYTVNLTQVRLIYQDTIKGWQDLGNRAALAHELECFGFLTIQDEQPQRAAKLFGAAEALREGNQSPMTDYERVEFDRTITQLHSMLTETEFNALWAARRSMTMEQAIQFTLLQ